MSNQNEITEQTQHEQKTLFEILSKLIVKEPFYGHLSIGINKFFSNRVPTACVGLMGINTELHINSKFWNTLNENQKIGLVKHEMLHICYFHLFSNKDYADKSLFNIAADICINQYIEEDCPPGS